ncbi:hypothetical protein CA264_01535 [Pontibacter actiniarum]|uniref:Uncharacterized protein n=1 Tax=Pontibacter actiniarum TaxID=323450 RepID=A0A1X9YN05_9BACT|nr:hypothetical protein CA264_01535 [Pontibacter actiniarum]
MERSCPRGLVLGVGALDKGIALLSLPALVPRAASLALVTGNSRGAQPKDWDQFDSKGFLF